MKSYDKGRPGPRIRDDDPERAASLPKRDGHMYCATTRLFFRGERRDLGGLSRNELRQALADALNDLDLLRMKLIARAYDKHPDEQLSDECMLAVASRHLTARDQNEEDRREGET